MTDMGPLHHFLGLSVKRRADSLFLSQRQYMLDILDRAGMSGCKPCSTPVDTHAKPSADGVSVADPTQFRSIAGALQYLAFTRPDIAYAVQQICLHMHDPKEPHLAAMKRILRYVQGTLTLVSIFTGPHLMILQSTLMLIGLVAPTPVVLPLATVCSWVTI